MMTEMETKSRKKKKMKKSRLCGKGLSKGEREENNEIYKKTMTEININFGK
jgi:hypothetical protein